MRKILKDIAEIKIGYLPRKENESGEELRCFLLPKDIVNAEFSLDKAQKICISNHSKFSIQTGEILLSSRGKFYAIVVTSKEEGCIASSLFWRIIIKDTSRILPTYLCAYFNSREGQKKLSSISACSTTNAITKSDLENMVIPLPSLEKQKSLGKLYSEFNKMKRLFAKKIDLTNKLINSKFKKIK